VADCITGVEEAPKLLLLKTTRAFVQLRAPATIVG
jgi:hypothetical protein